MHISEELRKKHFQKELQSSFSRFAQRSSRQAGRASSFVLALCLVAIWIVCGPFFNFSVAWQVAIDTTCTIITLLMVLLIQNTQYRDTQAIQIKLDELIQASKHARNDLIEIEKLTEGEIEEVRDIQREMREHGAELYPEKDGKLPPKPIERRLAERRKNNNNSK